MRSPTTRAVPAAQIGSSQSSEEPCPETPRGREAEVQSSSEASETRASPRQEFIASMKASEEESFSKCQMVLKKIREAMARQRNISINVQNGISELEELIDVIANYRRNWQTAEKQRGESRQREESSATTSTELASAHAPGQAKRSATSPADLNPKKKPKRRIAESATVISTDSKKTDNQPAKESTKKRRMRSKPSRLKEKPQAIIIKPQGGHSYADVLRSMRENLKPESTDVSVKSIRKTKTGALLVEMEKGGKREEFCAAIKNTLQETAVVRDLKPLVTVEFQDLDSLTTEEEVTAAVKRETNAVSDDIRVRLTAVNNREQKRAFVSLPVPEAKVLLKLNKIKVSLMNCRIRYRENAKRCYRCFGSGHTQFECKGPDRKGLGMCIKCGEVGHKMRECTNRTKCCICSGSSSGSTDHLPGSKNCKAGARDSI